jgi:sulfate adenylyltransferase (ADP) / ATP adenylyltransferase
LIVCNKYIHNHGHGFHLSCENTICMDSPATQQWLSPGSLWPALRATTQTALDRGALKPFATTYDWVEQDGVRFLVRVLANLQRKAEAAKTQKAKQSKGEDFNPFLPYEADLFVAELSPTHVAILNKFNVVDHHLLMITRAFESQENLLTPADFVALALCLAEVDGLGFYNGGKDAGASQRHKHLQLVPLPLVSEFSALPIEVAIQEAPHLSQIVHSSFLPFRHGIFWLDDLDFSQPLAIASVLHQRYLQLMESLQLLAAETASEPIGAYNLLVTRRWIFLIPRSQESHEKIAINSLGFAGALLVKTPEKLERLRHIGPMHLLQAVSYANS